MNFITLILVLCILVGCSAQGNPSAVVLATEEGCSPQQVVRIISCGCFIMPFASPVSETIHEQCQIATGNAVKYSQFACDSFLTENGTNYDFQRIVKSVFKVKDRCFTNKVIANNDISSTPDPVPNRAEQLFDIAKILAEIFTQPADENEIPNFDRTIKHQAGYQSGAFQEV